MVRSRPPAERIARRRVALEHISPSVDEGRFAAKATIGSPVSVEADVFADGHELVRGLLRWRHDDEHDWHEVPMRALGNDRFAGTYICEKLADSFEVRCRTTAEQTFKTRPRSRRSV